MKSERFYFFAKFSGEKGGGKPQTATAQEVFVTASAQPYVLREKMKEKELTHGETVTANFSPVRLEAAYGKMALYFCPMQTIDVLNTLTPGDGGDIPSSVVVEGLTIPEGFKPGLYALKNVQLSSNGSIQVVANEKTTWEMVTA